MAFNLTVDQQNIYEKIINDINEVRKGDIFGEYSWLSLKGPAGTGKTFLTKNIVSYLLSQNMKMAVLAPTHQAVSVIKNNIDIKDKKIFYATIHAFLGLKPGKINLETGERKFTKNCKKAKALCKEKVDIVILDESSMVGYELFDFLKEELYSRNRIKAFLFIGDACQLMPVEKEKDIKNYIHPIYENKTINHYSLTELIRNPDPEAITFVTEIRKMIENQNTKYDLFNFLLKEKEKEHNKIVFYDNKKEFFKKYLEIDRVQNPNDTIATFTNEKVQDYNLKIRDYYIKKLYNVNEAPEIVNEDLFVVQESTEDFQNSEILELKNYKDETFDFNGKTFEGYICTTTDGRTFNVLKKESKEQYDRILELLRLNAMKEKNRKAWAYYYELMELFLNVRYHYAYTIHKLQGSSYENIWVDCSGLGYVEDSMLIRLFYVGSTRSKNKIHILL